MRSLLLAAVLLVAPFIDGCSTSPRAAFYTLSPAAPPESVPSTAPPIYIAVDAVTIPDLVDRPQFVVRTGATQVSIDEFARWADPLKAQIARVLAADLAQAVPGALVSGYSRQGDAAVVPRMGRRAELRIRAGRDGEHRGAVVGAAAEAGHDGDRAHGCP